MASQWTIPKLVTWRVKDWASCFLACKIPLDIDEDHGANNNGNSTNNNNNLIFKRTKRKMKSKKKISERKLSLSPPGTRHHHLHLRSSSVSPTSASHHRRLSWPQPPVSDEAGFIVFCFDREDGGFDVVKEEKQEKKEVELPPEKSPRTVNRKLIYGNQGVGETEKNNTPEINGPLQAQDDKTTCQDVSCDVHEKKKEKEEEEEEICACDKSSGSNHSDEGRGSFAFPILGVEWMGSPVQMPKTDDDLSPKKPKPIALGFQCCRF